MMDKIQNSVNTNRLKMSENSVLRRIFGPKNDDVLRNQAKIQMRKF
jgi:hypothetical protein